MVRIMNEELQEQITQNTMGIKVISNDLRYLREGIDDMKETLRELRNEISKNFVNKNEFKGLQDRVSSLEDIKSWAVKIIVGSVILALLALLGLK